MNNAVLVHPRPVRLGSQQSWFARTMPAKMPSSNDENSPTSPPASSSNNSGTQESDTNRNWNEVEVLDEFLSILKPSFFPQFNSTRSAPTVPLLGHDRRRSLKSPLSRIDANSPAPSSTSENNNDNMELRIKSSTPDVPLKWFSSSVLASPVSRSHGARNPFSRHAANKTPISPSAVPLPLSPTPDPGEPATL